MTKLGSYTILTIVCSFLIAYPNLYAGQVPNILSVAGPGLESWDFWEIDFDRLNNDNASNSDPTVPVADNFVQIIAKTFGNIAYVDTVFQVADTGGTTEFQLEELFLANHTGIGWKGFYWELGFGTGSNFVQSDATDQLDFDTPDKDPMPYSNIFPTADHSSDRILWYGGLVKENQIVRLIASIDLPDINTVHPLGLSEFTVRQYPVPVPVPSSILLLGAVLVWLIGFRRSTDRLGHHG